MQQQLTDDIQVKIKEALSKLDQETIDLDGVNMIPSRCFHVELNPLHVLFNTNCPASLKEKVNGIISEHLPQRNTDSAAG